MRGYGPASYGDGFADTYDHLYGAGDDAETAAAVATIERLARASARDRHRPAVLELGVGTGRLAVPLAAAGLDVTGLDASGAMLERLAARSRATPVRGVLATLAGDPGLPGDGWPEGPFDVVFAARNTLLNETTLTGQGRCLALAAARLHPGGAFVVEADVPVADLAPEEAVTLRDLRADAVVLHVHRTRPDERVAEGCFVELRDGAPVRVRPWMVRLTTVAELDDLAGRAGLALAERWASWEGRAFDDGSPRHVSVYRPTGVRPGR